MTSSSRARHSEEDPSLDARLRSVFDAHADFVCRVLRRLAVPDADIEDAVQEVFVIVARKLPAYEERGEIRAWLFTIARQVAAHVRRSDARRARRHGALSAPEHDEDPHVALERSEAARFVQTFLSELDERQAAVFFLADVEGMTAPEIASCLSIGVNTVYARLRLARERFEKAVERYAERSGR